METVVVHDDSAKPSASVAIVLGLEVVGIVVATILFGLDLWVSVLTTLLLAAVLLRGWGMAAATIAVNASLGLAFAQYLYGFYTWPSALLGIGSIMLIGTFFTSNDGTQTQQSDANPILYIVLIITIRAWTALYYTTNDAITEVSSNFLTWLALFVLGVIPDLPLLANLILFLTLNGTLVLYLTLLLKRIANPLAN